MPDVILPQDFALVFVVTPCPYNQPANDAWMAAHQLVTYPSIVACTFKLAFSTLPPNIQATTEGTQQALALSVADPVTHKTV